MVPQLLNWRNPSISNTVPISMDDTRGIHMFPRATLCLQQLDMSPMRNTTTAYQV